MLAKRTEHIMDSKGNVGLVGLGAMGRGMAGSLRRAGWRVHVHDVRRESVEAFVADGGVACASPDELARKCDVIVSVVVNAAQTDEVLFGEQGAAHSMRPGNLFVMCSTVDPNWSITSRRTWASAACSTSMRRFPAARRKPRRAR
jgi:3-hydroxyisobutyrate dehydrogenase